MSIFELLSLLKVVALGLGVLHPDETIKRFQQNLLQKNDGQGRLQPLATLPTILAGLLDRANRPRLADHIQRMGPKQWKIRLNILKPWNKLLGLAFHAVVDLLTAPETSRD
jgi:hypothetical protein